MKTIQQLFDLSGRVALITGGSRGLGQEMAEGLSEAGAALMLVARREQWLGPAVESLRSRGVVCEGAICDVTDSAQVEAVAARTLERFGRLDILVNNAGATWGETAEHMPLDKWRMVLETNLTGAFLFSQVCGRAMIRQGSGRIINVASVAGLNSSLNLHYAAYAASKGGLLALTRELAANWARHNIRVNAIAPGFFPTRMTEKVLPRLAAQLEKSVPLGRAGEAGELKGAAVFLASDASSYVTGQTLIVDGGMTIV